MTAGRQGGRVTLRSCSLEARVLAVALLAMRIELSRGGRGGHRVLIGCQPVEMAIRPRGIYGLDARCLSVVRLAHGGEVLLDLRALSRGEARARIALALDGHRHLAPERHLVHAGDERL